MGGAVAEVLAVDGETDWVVEGWAGAGMAAGDPARVVGYVLSPLRGQYLAIMEVLEQSVDHLTPAEVRAALAAKGTELPLAVVTSRLRALSDTFLAASGRPDSQVERWHELNGARWRYSATPRGRQMQRLWTQMASDGLVPREIPMDGLSRIHQALRAMHGDHTPVATLSELAGQVFVEQDHLDGALVGQADMLAKLADRFNLDLRATGELKQLILEYATHVVVHLDAAVARIHAELVRLRPRFGEISAARRGQSAAGALVARGVLAPARGLRAADWEQLLGWFSPSTGKAARYGLQLVRAIPMLHANLLRHQSVGGPVTLRARALSLAVACQDPRYGRAVLDHALADRPWTKLHTVAEGDTGEVVSWHEGPRVAALAMHRLGVDLDTFTGGLFTLGIHPAGWHIPPGQPGILIPWVLRRAAWPAPPHGEDRWVFLTENPSVAAAALDTADSGVRLLCTVGTPSRSTLEAVARLAVAGWRIAVRADFDGGGLALVRAVLTIVPHARAWRMTASDYTASLHPTPFEPGVVDPDRLGSTPWDPSLATAMRETGRPAYEEALIDDLLADLRRGSPPPDQPAHAGPAATRRS